LADREEAVRRLRSAYFVETSRSLSYVERSSSFPGRRSATSPIRRHIPPGGSFGLGRLAVARRVCRWERPRSLRRCRRWEWRRRCDERRQRQLVRSLWEHRSSRARIAGESIARRSQRPRRGETGVDGQTLVGETLGSRARTAGESIARRSRRPRRGEIGVDGRTLVGEPLGSRARTAGESIAQRSQRPRTGNCSRKILQLLQLLAPTPSPVSVARCRGSFDGSRCFPGRRGRTAPAPEMIRRS
jgi:hypothetical protein